MPIADEMTDEDKARVAERWSKISSGSDELSANVYWLAVPAVMARHQRRACAGENYPSWVEYCVDSFLPGGGERRMLSVGCGYGDLERHLMRLHACTICDAVDIAPAAIESAIAAAAAEGFAGIHYRCADIETQPLEEGVYDAVWFNGSLHHIQALERVLERVNRSLKPGGLVFVNEYVGANHFGFPAAQREAIAHAFHLIPLRYRGSFVPESVGQLATQPPIPDPAEVRRADPSEAVRSQDIVPIIASIFHILTMNACGGTIMQFLLSGIAGNFRAEDPSSMLVLDMLFGIEDALIDTGAIGSDFVVIAARKRNIVATELEAPTSTDDVNSQAFFDRQFEIGVWERNNGPAQTRYFASRIVAELPAPDREFLSKKAVSILDWGCALGDGVDVLKHAFPQCTVIGQDFSKEAIKLARRIYPHYEFIVSEKIEREFDVIVVSNCLEHFSDPLRVAETQMASCRALYVVLVPFLEEPLMAGHVARFSGETFPQRLGSWTRLAARPIEMDGRYWNGRQLLVVYGSESYFNERAVRSDLFETATAAEPAIDTTADVAHSARPAAENHNGADHVQVEVSGEWNGWLDHPAIVEHYRRRGLIDGRSWPEFVGRQLGGPAERSLNLGCGAGERSFAVYDDRVAVSLEGLDTREERIALAEQIRRARHPWTIQGLGQQHRRVAGKPLPTDLLLPQLPSLFEA